MNQQELFSEFKSVDKEQWLTSIEKTLKGKPLDSLSWEAEDDLIIHPFFRKEDLPTPESTFLSNKKNNSWHIAERIIVQDAKKSNTQALIALRGGVNKLIFELSNDLPDFQILMKDILWSIIDIDWSIHGGLDTVDQVLKALTEVTDSELSGTIYWQIEDVNYTELARVLAKTSKLFPKLRLLPIQVNQTQDYSTQLATLLVNLKALCYQLNDEGIELNEILRHIGVTLPISDQSLVELAKVRALHRLVALFLQSIGSDKSTIVVHAITQSAEQEDKYWNMITASNQAIAAILGGVNSLEITPCTGNLSAEEFELRIARNVQHLLMMECHLDKVVDAAAGSYYIESLTEKIAAKAWAKFQSLV